MVKCFSEDLTMNEKTSKFTAETSFDEHGQYVVVRNVESRHFYSPAVRGIIELAYCETND